MGALMSETEADTCKIVERLNQFRVRGGFCPPNVNEAEQQES